ncbi:hypothetical protein SETIT_5G061800v2 [Setaria italica]|uniref:Uncharacterized protein n=2 Tax=Setaria TaxID=4554 RepID=A0A368R1W0_SETIT|nr:hypothetical protein SETIT_5G061800v2 [Setaria italica]TKW12839.1 hypothetical protein SEVIR_5G061200v2 [Setaria viridis]
MILSEGTGAAAARRQRRVTGTAGRPIGTGLRLLGVVGGQVGGGGTTHAARAQLWPAVVHGRGAKVELTARSSIVNHWMTGSTQEELVRFLSAH